MDIKKYTEVNGSNLSQQELLMYLSQVVLCKIDEGTRKEHQKLESSRDQVRQFRDKVKKKRSLASKAASELSKQKALSRVLTSLETLKREGLWAGQNGKKLSKLLETVEERTFQQLVELDEQLGIYLPG